MIGRLVLTVQIGKGKDFPSPVSISSYYIPLVSSSPTGAAASVPPVL